MTRNPVGTATFLYPMSGDPIATTMGRCIPMPRHFFVFSTIVMPLGTDPNMVRIRAGRAFYHVLMGSVLYIIMLCAGGERGQGEGGAKGRHYNEFLHRKLI